MRVYVNKQGKLMVSWPKDIHSLFYTVGYFFIVNEIELSPRFTALSPNEWGWEDLGFL